MILNIAKGNLLEASTDALVNTVNCVGVMGKGIALQFKRRYPEMYSDYRRACERGDVEIGKMHVFEVDQLSGPKFIINFPTKQHWKGNSSLEWIREGLVDLVRRIEILGITSIAIPPLGSGNGGLDWAEVEPLIREALATTDVRVELFPPTASGSRPVDRLARLVMSPSRALVLQLMRGYSFKRSELDPWDQPSGVSHLEIQKLMYIAQVLMPSLNLDFKQGHFGPYSEKVRHIVQEMEGQFTTGFGDGTAKVLNLDPIRITEEGERSLDQYLQSERGRQINDLSREVLRITDGYEDAYGVELLASTLMISFAIGGIDAGTDDAATVRSIADKVRGWNRRKGLIFTDNHVSKAVYHLRHAGV